MSTVTKPLSSHTDFLGNVIEVGDHVLVARVPDRTPQMYSGIVEDIRENQNLWRDTAMIQIRVRPSGLYSTKYWRHTWEYDQNWLGEKVVVAPPKANWIQAENVIKFPGLAEILLDKQPGSE
jgi:hypothetical protein